MFLLNFIIQVFHKNYNVLGNGGSLDRFVHDAPVKLYKICLSLYNAAIVLHKFRNNCEIWKNKIRSLNLNKSRLFNTNCLCTIKNFMNMLRFFEKKAFGGCKSQIHVIGYRIAGRETELGSLSDAE